MSEYRDPLIHGPGSDAPTVVPESVGAVAELLPPDYDLRSTQPIQDLLTLFRRPRALLSFFHSPDFIDRWVVFKAIGGLLLFSWLAEFVSGGRWVGNSLNEALPLLDRLAQNPLLASVDVAGLKQKLMLFLVAAAHFKMILAPLWDLIDVTGLAASAVLFLPLLGVSRAKVSFHSIFFACVYVRWFFVVSLIPIIGPILSPLLIIVFTVLTVKWIHETTAWKAFAATYLLYWLSLALIPLFAGILLALLIMNLAHG